MGDLTGKRAIICGSTQGIGLATARELARRGAAVALLARDEASLAAALDTLARDDGQRHAFEVADFADPEAVRDAGSRVVASGAVHVLVNNTGGPPGGPLFKAGTDELLRAFRMHVLASQLLAQVVVPGMKDAGYGRIVNIISTSVKQPIPGLGVSNTIRGAMASWSKTLANELGPFGITVNNVLPGATLTGRLRALIASKAKSEGVPESRVEEAMRATIPLRRFAEPEEVAAAVGYLASPAAAYVNGIHLPVDGGRTQSL